METGLDRWRQLVGDAGLDGWLVADFRRSNPLFTRFLGREGGVLSRRAFLWMPASGRGEPLVMGSRVDGHTFADLDLPVSLYGGYEDMAAILREAIPAGARVAMEWSPEGRLPTISRVDGGLIDLMRSWGVRVESSGTLVAALEVWDDRQRELHRRAARGVDEARRAALRRCGELLGRGERVTEGMLGEVILDVFRDLGLQAEHLPDVAAGPNAADPHYSGSGAEIGGDAVLLIDLVTKVPDAEGAPFADSTWMGFTGPTPPEDLRRDWEAVRDARDRAIAAIDESIEAGRALEGCQVDRLARDVLIGQGLGDLLVHRTGHSIGTDHVHGMGTNLDSVEFPDDRPLLMGSGVTVEPGVYRPGRWGVRAEVSTMLLPGGLEITTERQEDLTLIV